ncbi:hypothetical protein TWF694_010430 [Orbilia ellipsospora]|uniref:Secreted protein n=1 Tax=Orbilia ellipsospora TaxID=2528407 RepID=A0AAV9XB11_9PEZI
MHRRIFVFFFLSFAESKYFNILKGPEVVKHALFCSFSAASFSRQNNFPVATVEETSRLQILPSADKCEHHDDSPKDLREERRCYFCRYLSAPCGGFHVAPWLA